MQTKTTFHTHQSISVTGPKIDLHALYWYAHTYACVCVCVCMCLIEWCEGRTCLSRGARMYVCILRNYYSSWGCTQAYFPPVAHKQFWNVCIHTYIHIYMNVSVCVKPTELWGLFTTICTYTHIRIYITTVFTHAQNVVLKKEHYVNNLLLTTR